MSRRKHDGPEGLYVRILREMESGGSDVLLNPRHPDAARIRVPETEDFRFDPGI